MTKGHKCNVELLRKRNMCTNAIWSTEDTLCISCSAGTYQPEDGKDSCVPCPVGYYCTESSYEKQICPVGHFCPESSSDPTKCPAGSYQQNSIQGSKFVVGCQPSLMSYLRTSTDILHKFVTLVSPLQNARVVLRDTFAKKAVLNLQFVPSVIFVRAIHHR